MDVHMNLSKVLFPEKRTKVSQPLLDRSTEEAATPSGGAEPVHAASVVFHPPGFDDAKLA